MSWVKAHACQSVEFVRRAGVAGHDRARDISVFSGSG